MIYICIYIYIKTCLFLLMPHWFLVFTVTGRNTFPCTCSKVFCTHLNKELTFHTFITQLLFCCKHPRIQKSKGGAGDERHLQRSCYIPQCCVLARSAGARAPSRRHVNGIYYAYMSRGDKTVARTAFVKESAEKFYNRRKGQSGSCSEGWACMKYS